MSEKTLTEEQTNLTKNTNNSLPETGAHKNNQRAPVASPSTSLNDAEDLEVRTSDTKKTRTAGWKLFDFLVYGVMQYGINIGLSLVMWWDNEFHGKEEHLQTHKQEIEGMTGVKKAANQVLHGYRKGFKKVNEVTVKYFSEPVANGVMKILPEKSLQAANGKIRTPNKTDVEFKGKLTNFLTGYALLAWGGRLLMAPNKWLEDAKPKLVRKFDNMFDSINGMFGKKVTDQQLQERAEIYQKLDGDLATESWGNLIQARVLGELAVGGAVLAPLILDSERKGVARIGEAGLKLAGKVEGLTGEKDRWSFLKPKAEGTFDALNPPKANKIHGLAFAASIEGVATGIVATYLYLKLKSKELFGNKDASKETIVNAKEAPKSKNIIEKENSKVPEKTHIREQTTSSVEKLEPSNHRANIAQRDASYGEEATKEANSAKDNIAIPMGA